jgi:hypothetical protein
VTGYRCEQPVRLALDPVGEVKDIGTAVVAADTELDFPETARGEAAGVDRDRPVQLSLLGMKAFISLCLKLKFPTSTSLLNRRKPAGTMVIPQGAASPLPATSSLMKLLSSSKIATAPAPNGALISAGRPACA